MGDEEALSRVAKRQLEGVMFHTALAQWFDAASVWGARMRDVQLRQAREEFAGYLRTLRAYADAECAPLVAGGAGPEAPGILKPEWAGGYPDVDREAAEAIIAEGMRKWLDWEKATLAEYQSAYGASPEPEQGACVSDLLIEGLMDGVRREIRAIRGWMGARG